MFPKSWMASLKQYAGNLSRRELIRSGSLAVIPGLLSKSAAAAPAPATGGLQVGPNIYESIGVRPFICGTGTLTVNSGSLELPEVRAAMEAASQHMVQLDELMDAVGKRLAALTGAEFGMVSSGCAAAITHATTACLVGGNPDQHIKLPHPELLAKDEVIIPKHSRNNYDAAIRATGVRIIEVQSAEELETAIGPRTAMIYIFAGPRADTGSPSFEEITGIARRKNVPVLTDAAAEGLTIPNVHLQRGSTLVAYSGGKQLRGPQCSGLLLGRKDLVKAAWVCSAPHHGFSRSMKVGKEEIIGALAAVEAFVKRDEKAYWQDMADRLAVIGKRVSAIPGVTFEVRPAGAGLSNRTAGLTVRWEPAERGITPAEVVHILDTTDPRILVGGSRGNQNGISISGFNLGPGHEKIISDRLYAVLSAKHTLKTPEAALPPAADLTGQWNVHIEYAAGTSKHSLSLQQRGARLEGIHQGDFLARDLSGQMNGDKVQFRSLLPEHEVGNALTYTFSGTVNGETMSGDLDLGEYLKAKWSARKHQYAANPLRG
ncbi:MAG: hypothetical protein ABJF23_01935 [Bryobacteraceae bacterium]